MNGPIYGERYEIHIIFKYLEYYTFVLFQPLKRIKPFSAPGPYKARRWSGFSQRCGSPTLAKTDQDSSPETREGPASLETERATFP